MTAGPSILSLLAPALLLALIALPLLIRGIRGSIVSDHPFCRRCGFDLFGLTQLTVCPECGSSLRRHKAVRNGERRRRWKPLAAGLLLLIVGITWSGLGIANHVGAFNINRHKPTWWLIAVETRLSPPTADRAVYNLLLRNLNNSQLTALAQRGLKIQADPTQPWQPGWGEMIERARANHLLSDQDWVLYVNAASHLSLNVRRQVRQGQRIPAVAVYQSFHGRGLSRILTCQSFAVSGVELLQSGPIQLLQLRSANFALPLSIGDLQPGQAQRYISTWRIEHFECDLAGNLKQPPIATKVVQFTGEVTILPLNQPTVTPLTGPQLNEQVRDSLNLWIEFARYGQVLTYDDIWGSYFGPEVVTPVPVTTPVSSENDTSVAKSLPKLEGIYARVRASHLSVPLAVDIIQEKDGRSVVLGNTVLRTGASRFGVAVGVEPPFRIALRPSGKLAEETVDLESYYAGPEIVFECDAVPESGTKMIKPQYAGTTQPAATQLVSP